MPTGWWIIGHSPTLILDRAKGTFLAAEVARIRRLFPLLAALHRRHLGTIVTAGIDPGNSPIGPERPLRFVDQHGHQIFSTAAWAEQSRDAEVAQALQVVTARGPCTVHLKGHMALRRTQLPPDFGPAPGGYCDEISPDRQAGAAALSPRRRRRRSSARWASRSARRCRNKRRVSSASRCCAMPAVSVCSGKVTLPAPSGG